MISKNLKNIKITIRDEAKAVKFNKARLGRMIESLCGRFKIKSAAINILITDSAGIKKVNREFLKSAKNTDVISFDLSDELDSRRVFDMVVNSEMAWAKAKKLGHSSEAELALYVVHGFLHNAGFDDLAAAKAKKMHRMEDLLLTEFGYGQVYTGVAKRA
ncbi:MAG: rRNA maturation RNase YbeY [Planctomycetes bacterium GWF2_50_10]|nr:MAG: rRNA maturation RNase YbeY [Planctomycetes bacterium GWF2_50_10]